MKIGGVVLKVTMARFSRTLSTLVSAGVDIIQALDRRAADDDPGRQLVGVIVIAMYLPMFKMLSLIK